MQKITKRAVSKPFNFETNYEGKLAQIKPNRSDLGASTRTIFQQFPPIGHI